jgi:predicted O-linked N-acetylglucosamine transferase (SPINDLY family)
MAADSPSSGAPDGSQTADAAFRAALELRRRGEAERADALCVQLLETDPRHASAYHLRGLMALERGALMRGIELIERALAIDPHQALARSNLGNALLSAGDSTRALAHLDEAVRLKPDFAGAHFNRGIAQNSLGRLHEALASYDAALHWDPSHAQAMNNRGIVLRALGRLDEAVSAFQRACGMGTGFAAAQTNLANVLLMQDRAADALTCFDRALGLAPGDCAALHGRGTALLALHRWDEAARDFAAVLKLEPLHHSALSMLFHLRMDCCDWHDHDDLSLRLRDSMRRSRQFVTPLSLLMLDDPELGLACARQFVAERPPQAAAVRSPPAAERRSTGKLRVAYVSADFCDHPVAHLLVGVLERHDRERFEVIGVLLRPRGAGRFEQRVLEAFDRCIDAVGMSDAEVAARLRAEGVDIAVDLMGFTEGMRPGIFAHRAAPVQVNYLGYAGTSGAPYMDYVVADAVAVPPDQECWFSERVWRLPHCYLPTDDHRSVGPSPTRTAAGLPARGFVFCAFTKAHKIVPSMFHLWMRLLRGSAGSVLWLRDMGRGSAAHLIDTAQRCGVDGARLIFAPRVADTALHLGRLALADLYLDTLPYNAHSTACDALWAGVPVVTVAGKSFASRVAASVVAAAGLSELVTDSLESYERCAQTLVEQPGRLAALRARVARAREESPLFDTARYTRDLEAAFRRMHEKRA